MSVSISLLRTISIESAGFKKYIRESVRLDANDRLTVDAALEIHESLGSNPAIIIGDYYFAKGANLLASIGEPSIDLAISNTVMTICLGELLQLASHGDYDQSLEEYHRKIARKTAALVETCCYCGAVVAHLDAVHTEALRQYGRGRDEQDLPASVESRTLG